VLDPSLLGSGGDDSLLQLKSDLAEKTNLVKTLTESVLQKQSTASSLRKSLEDISTRVPELQESKKVAVKGRNFKEAQRLQEEVKSLETQQVAQTTELKELNAALLTETEELDATKEMETTLQGEWTAKEVGFDTAAIKELRAKNEELREKILALAAGTKEIATLLQVDAEACELLEEQLCIKHGLEFAAPEQSLDDVVATALLGTESSELLLMLDDPVAGPEDGEDTEQDAIAPVTGDLASLDLTMQPTDVCGDAGEADADADAVADVAAAAAAGGDELDAADALAGAGAAVETDGGGDSVAEGGGDSVVGGGMFGGMEVKDEPAADDTTAETGAEAPGEGGGMFGGMVVNDADDAAGADDAADADADAGEDEGAGEPAETPADAAVEGAEDALADGAEAGTAEDEGGVVDAAVAPEDVGVDTDAIHAQLAKLEEEMEAALAEEDYDACEHIHDSIEKLKAQLPDSEA